MLQRTLLYLCWQYKWFGFYMFPCYEWLKFIPSPRQKEMFIFSAYRVSRKNRNIEKHDPLGLKITFCLQFFEVHQSDPYQGRIHCIWSQYLIAGCWWCESDLRINHQCPSWHEQKILEKQRWRRDHRDTGSSFRKIPDQSW